MIFCILTMYPDMNMSNLNALPHHEMQGRRKRGGGAGGAIALPPATELGGRKHIILPAPKNIESAPRKNCVENAGNSITPLWSL